MTKLENQTVLIPALPSVLLGYIQGLDEQGNPVVSWEGQTESYSAYTQQPISSDDIGKACTLAFIDGDETQPIVMGILFDPETAKDEAIVLESKESIILKSGKAQIELHANGRIHLQGMHISSQAYGPNQLKGASVKIN